MKKLKADDLKTLRDSLHIPITDEQIDDEPVRAAVLPPGRRTTEGSSTCSSAAAQLGGFVPERRTDAHAAHAARTTRSTTCLAKGSGTQEVATTMALVRLFKDLVKDKEFGHRIVPIIPDEARTFGLDSIFPSAKIFNTHGQNYLAVDRELMLSYKESESGPDHAHRHQRGRLGRGVPGRRHVVRDARRAADPVLLLLLDVRVPAHRRPVLGRRRPDDPRVPHRRHRRPHHADRRGPAARRRALAAAGRHHAARRALRPGVRVRDPAHRARRHRADVRRGPTTATATSSTTSPSTTSRCCSRPSRRTSTSRASCAASTCIAPAEGDGPRAQILASGVGVPWALEAQQLLADDWGVRAAVWSVTSWNELRRDGLAADAARFLHPGEEPRDAVPDGEARRAPRVRSSRRRTTTTSSPTRCARGSRATYATLGADGFGFSDTRAAARRHFKIDGPSTVGPGAAAARPRAARWPAEAPAQAIERYRLHDVTAGTSGNAGGDS